MPDITLQQIETFLTVAEHLSFSEAANAMYISQPALSKIIGRLESGIGTPLFSRKSHGIVLTKEGEYLYNELRPVCNKITKALKNVNTISLSPQKILRLAYHTSYDYVEDISPFGVTLRQYKENNPDITVVEDLFELQDLRNALSVGDVDAIFAATFVFEDLKGISYKRINVHHFHILASVNHPLASCENLPLPELSNETFFFVSFKHKDVDEYERCAQMGFVPKNIVYMPNFPSVINAVRQGKGMTFCGNIVTTLTDNDMKYFRIPDPPNLPYNGVAWRANDISKEALDFIDMLQGI